MKNTKLCVDCQLKKSTSEFSKYKRNKDGLYSYCNKCVSIRVTAWRKANPKKYKKQYNTYKKNNPEKIKKYRAISYYRNRKNELKYGAEYARKFPEKRREIQSRWRKKNPKYVINYTKKRLKRDSLFKLRLTLSCRLNSALKRKKWQKDTHFKQYIGCSLKQLKEQLESNFSKGMNWKNHGKWHIDHIIPLSSAKTPKQMYKLCNYKNLQPLWAKDNLMKSDKIYPLYTSNLAYHNFSHS